MARQRLIYGLDIETDTRIDGLDPGISSVVAIAISTIRGTETLVGDEWLLLAGLEQHLASLEPGVIATWNGALYDLPFIYDRAAFYGIRLGLRLEASHRVSLGKGLVGHQHAYRASWHGHAHVDLCRMYQHSERPAPACNLAQEALHAKATRDAELVRALASRRWNSVISFIDQTPSAIAPPVNHDKRVAAITQQAS